MTQALAIQQNLTSLAILKVNWDGGHDYIENFIPFVAQALSLSSHAEVSLPDLQGILAKEFGLTIPQGPLKTILKRAARRGYVAAAKGIYTRNDAALAKLDFTKTQQAVLRQHNTLIEKLVDYCKTGHDVTWTTEEAEAGLLGYLARDGLPVISHRVKAPIFRDFPASKKKDFLIASFVHHLNERDAAGFEYLETLVKGGMLADVLYFPEIGNIKSSFKDLEVYFDTNFLLRAMGFAGRVKQDSCRELLDLLYELNANLRCFEHTVQEVRGVLNAAGAFLRNHGKGVVGTFETYDHFAAQGFSVSDVDLVLAKLPSALSSIRVKPIETPSHSSALTVDEVALERLLETKYNFRKEEARYKDVRSITAIYRLRGGRLYHDVDSCKAIFVTTNNDLANAVIEFFGLGSGGQVPLCLPDDVFATHAWLKKPTLAPDLPRKRLIADCYAALNPSDELWARYTKEIDKLQQSSTASDDDYAVLRYSAAAKTALMDATCGDPAAFTEGTIAEVLDKAKATMRADLLAVVAVKEQGRSEADLRAEAATKLLASHRVRARSLAVAAGKWVARIIRIGSVIFLLAGLGFTFPGVLDIPKGLSMRFVLFALLIVFAAMSFANLYWGTTARRIIRRIERWVSAKVEALLLKHNE